MQLGEEMEEEAMNGYETYSATVQKSGCNCACVGGGTGYGRVLLLFACDVVPMAYRCIYSIGKRKGFGLFEEVN